MARRAERRDVSSGEIEAVREFNRFYTRRIGALNEGLLRSPFSLTEMRVLYELAHRERATAAELCADLGLDAGYLSRILRSFAAQSLVARAASENDGRRREISLTPAGRETFAPFDRRSSEEVAGLLGGLSGPRRRRLVAAMKTIREILAGGEVPRPRSDVRLRAPRPGDLGWIVHRHGALYSSEYGWGDLFEGLVAKIAGDFLSSHDPKSERSWLAELDGEIVGSVMLVRKSGRVAKLRLLLVEPSARGLGIGRRLVEACIAFARDRGYRKVELWTNPELHAARAIYEKTGFRLVRTETTRVFGKPQTAQTWELSLGTR